VAGSPADVFLSAGVLGSPASSYPFTQGLVVLATQIKWHSTMAAETLAVPVNSRNPHRRRLALTEPFSSVQAHR